MNINRSNLFISWSTTPITWRWRTTLSKVSFRSPHLLPLAKLPFYITVRNGVFTVQGNPAEKARLTNLDLPTYFQYFEDQKVHFVCNGHFATCRVYAMPNVNPKHVLKYGYTYLNGCYDILAPLWGYNVDLIIESE